jgi:hypothetical protein
MSNEIEQDQNDVILKRVPPGDRWIFAKAQPGGIQGDVHESLTDALEAWYQYAGDTEFYIDARRGVVEKIVEEEEIEEEVVVKKFSLYGED